MSITLAQDDKLQFIESNDLVRPSQMQDLRPNSACNARTKDKCPTPTQGMWKGKNADFDIDSICGNRSGLFSLDRISYADPPGSEIRPA